MDGTTLFSKVDSNKLQGCVTSKVALIYARFGAYLTDNSKVISRKTNGSSCSGPHSNF